MDDSEKERAQRLVDELKDSFNCGLLLVEGKVVVRCHNVRNFTDTATIFGEVDLKNAIELGLLEKREYRELIRWEDYQPKKS